jgi:hydroxypyruvate isomerase
MQSSCNHLELAGKLPDSQTMRENMPKFNANLTMLFTEVDFLERFKKAADQGFEGVEYLFPYDWPAGQLAALLDQHGLKQVLHNLPAGDWGAGERGIACLPGRQQEFQDGVGRAIEYAKTLDCPALNCLVGLTPASVSAEVVQQTLLDNLRFAADELSREGIKLLVEPLNDKDIPGFHLVTSKATIALLDELAHPNIKLQYDIYHMQRMEGELINTISQLADRIGHIQLADNPGRHEPGTGEINWKNLFKAIDETGYQGWIGCEYIPAAGTEAGLGWLGTY